VAEKIQAIKGMNDILPVQIQKWQAVENTLKQCLNQYGYDEIRFPLLESTQLFKRSIGEVTDIVEKEMYTFTDLNGDSLTLRPEGTAGCLRACLEHGLLHNQQQKLWYMGPMYRHEKPQKGRYRQFHQLGVEAIGFPGPAIELELIALCRRIWKKLGIDAVVKLEINTLGVLSERKEFRKNLIAYLEKNEKYLDADSRRRLYTNPLRVLDSKNPETKQVIEDAPKLFNFLEEASQNHFSNLCDGLKNLNIEYAVNAQLVRGLDYYGHTVFEWTTDKLGSQSTICGGGRFDGLVSQLGGNDTPAVGFALGLERLLLLMDALEINILPHNVYPKIFIVTNNLATMLKGIEIAESIRSYNANWQVVMHPTEGSFKSQFKKADKMGADFAIVVGEEELKNGLVSVKNLHIGDQATINEIDLLQCIAENAETFRNNRTCS
jgi:histidyl-tRNA synthetase